MRSILFGSAAAIVVVASAQAADLPTRKSAPAEYVKVCNVGGMAGFVIPGSDTCLKISGYVTAQVEGGNLKSAYSWSTAPGSASVLFGAANNARNSFGWTTRANVDLDARTDTPYGVLRGYVEMQYENGNGFDTDGTGSYINLAYVQWAGITAGKAASFFSFFGGGEGWANIASPDQQGFNQPDLLAYTATFGGGFSATIAAQSSGLNNPGFTSSATAGSDSGWGGSGNGTNLDANTTRLGMEAPDIVANVRLDQGWGAAQLAGVAHQVRVEDALGYHENTWGWAVDGGVKFNLPSFGPGDNVSLQGVWSQNAIWYSGIPDMMWGENGAVNGNGLAMVTADTWSNGNGTFATPTTWTIGGTFEHHFSQYFSIDPEFSYVNLHWSGVAGDVIPRNADSWIVGAVAHWDPVPKLDFSLELLYENTHQSTPAGFVPAGVGLGPSAFPNSADGFAGRFYITRNF